LIQYPGDRRQDGSWPIEGRFKVEPPTLAALGEIAALGIEAADPPADARDTTKAPRQGGDGVRPPFKGCEDVPLGGGELGWFLAQHGLAAQPARLAEAGDQVHLLGDQAIDREIPEFGIEPGRRMAGEVAGAMGGSVVADDRALDHHPRRGQGVLQPLALVEHQARAPILGEVAAVLGQAREQQQRRGGHGRRHQDQGGIGRAARAVDCRERAPRRHADETTRGVGRLIAGK